MSSRKQHPVAALAVGLAVGAAVVATAVGARGAEIGTLTFAPTAGPDTASITVSTSAGCPAAADAYLARAFGHGFPTAGQVVTGNTDAGLSHTTGFDAHFGQTMKDYAADNNTTLEGTYNVTVSCINSFDLTSLGDFTGSMVFSDATHWVSAGASGSPSPTVTTSASGSPSDSPSPTDSPTADPNSTGTPDPVPTPSVGGVDTTAPGSVPVTGAPVAAIGAIGVALLLAGIAAVAVSRRRLRSDADSGT
jgi:hypothetical protein